MIFLFALISGSLSGQEEGRGIIEGRIYNTKNNEPIPFANIVIWGTSIGSISDLDGRFIFTGIRPGFVELRASSVGYKPFVSQAFQVTNARKVFIEIAMEETDIELDAVVVKASPFRRVEESPVSLSRLGIEEIEKNPGGNRDISRVIQSLPGIAPSVSFRNDLIVRGGGPNENRFYLDGVEIPNLNHFATQGASGGPAGIINVDFIREIDFYSGAFPANRGNTLSSVLDMKQIDGNPDNLQFRATVGASDLALTLDGPLSPKSTFIFSLRRSYLQFLFDVIGLPFLPTYNDYQFKTRTRLNEKNELIVLSIGSYDVNQLNLSANSTEDQRYILNYLPVNRQWSYAIGAVWKHFRKNSYDTWVVSRNYLDNSFYKYQNNIETDSLKTLDYKSAEIENKFRYENTSRTVTGFKFNYGANFEYARYLNNTFQKIYVNSQPVDYDFSTSIDMFKWGFFGQASRNFIDNRLGLSLGLRLDANSYAKEMSDMLDQFSPRLSASWAFTDQLSLNFNAGRFYQIPPYTTLGYRGIDGSLVNKNNGLKYMRSEHLITGIEYLPNPQSRLSVEGFYKYFSNYPFSVRDSVPLSSKAADFGTFGNEEVVPASKGRAYGMEIYYRHKDFMGFNIILSYTWVTSQFREQGSDLVFTGRYIPAAWDNKHILNVTATRKFKRDWDAGFKWRFVGGAPYTPFDEEKSGFVQAWDVQGLPYLDYSRFNQLRLGPFHQLDLRIDKGYFFDRWSLRVYLDIQNVYNFKSDEPVRLINENENGIMEIANPLAPPEEQRYVLRSIKSDGQGTILPTVGIIIEF